MLQGIIFDLDGVLVFTDGYHYKGWKALADRLGIAFDETINNRLRGVSREESLHIVLENYHGPAFSEEEKQALAAEKNSVYRGLLETLSPADVTDTVRQTLTELKAAGYRLAIGSSSKNTPLILEKTGLAPFFEAVSDGNSITHSKPHPEVFLNAAAALKLLPGQCAVVEDAKAGIDGAKAAGMFAVGIGDAASYAKTDAAISSLAQLQGVLPQ